MPSKITLMMLAERDLFLPKFTGHIARALFLHSINRVNPSLAQRLHQPNALKPYTVEPLYFRSKDRSLEGYVADSSKPIKLVIKSLNDALFQEITKYLSSARTLMIRDVTLFLQGAHIQTLDYDSIMKNSEDVSELELNFVTPTYLSDSRSEYFSLFPEPRRLFMNLLRIWNSFSPIKIEKSEYMRYWRWLEEKVGVNMYYLNTVPIEVERLKAKVGFVGYIGYVFKDYSYSRLTDALVRFSEFSNVGGGRTSGMGVVKVTRRKVCQKNTEKNINA
ncbi:MAG: CRISPR system precrRNA processing endoribonuclease RAMP protein Cas6 [Candidatus Methanomethylicaceae archaeon]